ncbi:MAG: hypothetical protein M5R40_17490 [Anaerolineae bacterium]|nr:hypothetical protein [Anaerolineae bacterium]
MRARGYDVALFDAMLADPEAEWARALDQHRPRFAVLFEDNFNYLSKMCLLRMRHAAFNMIDLARAQGCTVIVCGSDATDHADLYRAQGADYVVVGEGEATLGALLDALTGRSDRRLEDIVGVASDAHPSPARRPAMRDLDALPFPAWDLVDVPRYQEMWYQRHGHYSMNMVTDARLPLSLQLVRQADLGAALQRPQPGKRRRRVEMA